ncbi:MAG: hypothetical protein M1829_006816 [Trizodia sp. TS-e1964]|nr:MAG: hypothetical protein M1829_006816 [Trizodia sp. TS-e1964]
MPYNTTALPPRSEGTGQTRLPLTRIKRIIQVDEDIRASSSGANFLITIATELFIQYLAEQGHNVVKAERKPRRNIQYKDIANAVSRIDNLEFLSDVVPKTLPYKLYKEKMARDQGGDGEGSEDQTASRNGNGNGKAGKVKGAKAGASKNPSESEGEGGESAADTGDEDVMIE